MRVHILDTNTFHATHGRPLPFATGLKLAPPDLKVVIITVTAMAWPSVVIT